MGNSRINSNIYSILIKLENLIKLIFFSDLLLILSITAVLATEFCEDGKCTSRLMPVPDDACENEFFGIHPHPDRRACKNFYVCLNYNLIEFRCDPGSIFDIETLSCQAGDSENCT